MAVPQLRVCAQGQERARDVPVVQPSQGLFRTEEEQLLSEVKPPIWGLRRERRAEERSSAFFRRVGALRGGIPDTSRERRAREGLRQVSVDSWPQDRLYRMGDRPVCCLKYFPKKDWLAKWSSSEIWSIVRLVDLSRVLASSTT